MAYTFYSQGAVGLIYWHDAPDMADLDAVVADVHAVAERQSKPGALFWVAVSPETSGPPAGPVARACGERIHEIARHCAHMSMVFEGSGFFVGFKRSVLTGILLTGKLVGGRNPTKQFRIHASLEEMHESAPGTYRDDLRAVLDQLYAAQRGRATSAA